MRQWPQMVEIMTSLHPRIITNHSSCIKRGTIHEKWDTVGCAYRVWRCSCWVDISRWRLSWPLDRQSTWLLLANCRRHRRHPSSCCHDCDVIDVVMTSSHRDQQTSRPSNADSSSRRRPNDVTHRPRDHSVGAPRIHRGLTGQNEATDRRQTDIWINIYNFIHHQMIEKKNKQS